MLHEPALADQEFWHQQWTCVARGQCPATGNTGGQGMGVETFNLLTSHLASPAVRSSSGPAVVQ